MNKLNAWKILAGIGLLFIGWGIHQAFVIPPPTYEPGHWDWLTKDPVILDYIRFWFRNQGIWTIANGLFFSIISATAFRKQERWAWYALTYIPVHIIFLTSQFYWLFFITIPILLVSIWALWKNIEMLSQVVEKGHNYGWILFTFIGFLILYFAYDNIFVLPALDVNDPDRGWAWLTTDPEVMEYIKFYFRIFGLRVLSVALMTILTASIGLREGSRNAWNVLFIIPVLFAVHMVVWPWLFPILIGLIFICGIALWMSFPKKAMSSDQEFEKAV